MNFSKLLTKRMRQKEMANNASTGHFGPYVALIFSILLTTLPLYANTYQEVINLRYSIAEEKLYDSSCPAFDEDGNNSTIITHDDVNAARVDAFAFGIIYILVGSCATILFVFIIYSFSTSRYHKLTEIINFYKDYLEIIDEKYKSCKR